MSFEFLHDLFQLPECSVGYLDDFVNLEERWAFYRCYSLHHQELSVLSFSLL